MEIVDKAKLFVIDFFEHNKDQKFVFHTLEHTMHVVRQAEFLGKQEQLGEKDLQALLIAAWFHDIGYLVRLENHEEAGLDIARSFFASHQADPGLAKMVEACIEATKRNREPQTMPEKIILDADVSHIGNDRFISISKRLRKERGFCQNRDIPAIEYWKETLNFLESQQFYTHSAKQQFQATKLRNTEEVKKIISDLEQKITKTKSTLKDPTTTRGIESMFRLTANNQMRLSSIADKKANILISINSILLSVSAAAASSNPISIKELRIPVIVLFVASLLSLIFAILSCRPKLNSRKYSAEDINARKVNLLFFGNFVQIPFPQYQEAVKEMMRDYDYLYSTMIKDQYYLGQSLSRKYKLLRTAYNIFMYGFILAAIVFAVSYLIMG